HRVLGHSTNGQEVIGMGRTWVFDMMRVRPTVSLVLIGALMASLFAACTPPSGPSGTVEPRETPGSIGEPETEVEQVRFASGDNVLAGTLYLPRTRGPHPALSLVLGSGSADRTYGGTATALAQHFARHGFACLSWDKPGVGQSTGDYHTQTFRDRADEALAA